jgi:hypothetical protein
MRLSNGRLAFRIAVAVLASTAQILASKNKIGSDALIFIGIAYDFTFLHVKPLPLR